jgi:hypothetical protein
LPRFEHGNVGDAALGESQRSRQPREPAADNAHVDTAPSGERRVADERVTVAS